jgi:hypothetical protein
VLITRQFAEPVSGPFGECETQLLQAPQLFCNDELDYCEGIIVELTQKCDGNVHEGDAVTVTYSKPVKNDPVRYEKLC